MTFVKGQSGNPKGRPRKPFADEVRQVLAKQAGPGQGTNRRKLAEAMLAKALEGDVAAAKFLIERADGPLQSEVLPPAVTVNVGIRWPWELGRDDGDAVDSGYADAPRLAAGRGD